MVEPLLQSTPGPRVGGGILSCSTTARRARATWPALELKRCASSRVRRFEVGGAVGPASVVAADIDAEDVLSMCAFALCTTPHGLARAVAYASFSMLVSP